MKPTKKKLCHRKLMNAAFAREPIKKSTNQPSQPSRIIMLPCKLPNSPTNLYMMGQREIVCWCVKTNTIKHLLPFRFSYVGCTIVITILFYRYLKIISSRFFLVVLAWIVAAFEPQWCSALHTFLTYHCFLSSPTKGKETKRALDHVTRKKKRHVDESRLFAGG